ncbi:MAG: D-glycero-beta-D-manno-heptose-1,7-bisphosphate 7-phosphatase [candidate division BRC1 bacterium ADurb.BinA364]|nr:MAG: D-glycero-beta-D-manno-heptose-1,7-bisphosphate 7-phosphatase [candidate division BRC1 bacterium ADurb.BinA364]
MIPACFLDRDGTIISQEEYPILRPEQLKLLPGAGRAIRSLNDAGWPVIVVSNQAIVARGLIDEAGLDALHAHLRDMLRLDCGGRIDAIYYCPHHPNPSEPTRVERYCLECECRKPKPGLLLRAACDLGIDLARSILIGDSTGDAAAARAAGARSILLTEAGHAGQDGVAACAPDWRASDLLSAAALALRHLS